LNFCPSLTKGGVRQSGGGAVYSIQHAVNRLR
jgi:hypothetical protein